MSDDELPPVGSPEDFNDEGSDGDMDFNPPAELPEGIKKEIITEAPSESYKKPKTGDEVTVHYVGTLESDGTEFDSSRARSKPFEVTLGKGQVIKGWDLGVATMKKGEVAKFTLAPEYAYGDEGSPPKIPEKATLIFEVELISWKSKDDLFGDEGVIKTLTKEGSGWKTPKKGDEVFISLKSTAADGTVIEERGSFEYCLGSATLGPLAKACDQALQGMKKGEEAELKCTKDYAYGDQHPDGATLTISLTELYETKDVSFAKDTTVMKKMVKEGEGWETPKDAAKVKLSVESATDGTSPLPSFSAKQLEFTLGNGEVCDALECALCEMKKTERAVLTVTNVKLIADEQLGLKDITADKVLLTVELVEFEKPKETYSMSEEEKLEYGLARKEVGTQLFKAGRLALALQRYKKVGDLFNYIDNIKEENKTKAKDLKKVCDLNKAACHLKLKEFPDAKSACNAVLKEDKENAKALYRRAQADYALKNFIECIADCKKIVQMDNKNKEARELLKQAQAGQKEIDKQAKGMFANMCKALGKGPIPEPYKEKKPQEDMDDDDDDDDEDDDEGEGTAPPDAEKPVDGDAQKEESQTTSEAVGGESGSAGAKPASDA